MRIAGFTITKCKNRQDVWRRRTIEVFLLVLDDVIVMHALQRANIYCGEVLRMNPRTRHVCSIQFNLNSISDNQYLKDFRFKKAKVGRIIDMIGLSDKTNCNK